jgi:hypothetical protein
MKPHRNNNIEPDISKNKNIDREFELKAINRILNRRYEVLIELS